MSWQHERPAIARPHDSRMARVVRIDPARPDPAAVVEAAGILRAGGLVVFPTDTLYALGADALNESAVRRLYEVKGRDFSKALLIFVGEEKQVDEFVVTIPAMARRLIDRFWPGPLTLVFEASPILPPLLLGGSTRIGVRLPASSLVRQLVIEAGVPITGTSANLSGRPTPPTAQGAFEELGGMVDLILDGGASVSQRGSTVLDVSRVPPQLLREGEVPAAAIEKVIGSLPGIS